MSHEITENKKTATATEPSENIPINSPGLSSSVDSSRSLQQVSKDSFVAADGTGQQVSDQSSQRVDASSSISASNNSWLNWSGWLTRSASAASENHAAVVEVEAKLNGNADIKSSNSTPANSANLPRNEEKTTYNNQHEESLTPLNIESKRVFELIAKSGDIGSNLAYGVWYAAKGGFELADTITPIPVPIVPPGRGVSSEIGRNTGDIVGGLGIGAGGAIGGAWGGYALTTLALGVAGPLAAVPAVAVGMVGLVGGGKLGVFIGGSVGARVGEALGYRVGCVASQLLQRPALPLPEQKQEQKRESVPNNPNGSPTEHKNDALHPDETPQLGGVPSSSLSGNSFLRFFSRSTARSITEIDDKNISATTSGSSSSCSK